MFPLLREGRAGPVTASVIIVAEKVLLWYSLSICGVMLFFQKKEVFT